MAIYTVQENTQFDAGSYPLVASEVSNIREKMSHFPAGNKSAIVISFFKDHCLDNRWLADNKAMTTLVLSSAMKSPHVEALFEGCRNRKMFLEQFEHYIHAQLG
jgi:hypothetical protein